MDSHRRIILAIICIFVTFVNIYFNSTLFKFTQHPEVPVSSTSNSEYPVVYDDFTQQLDAHDVIALANGTFQGVVYFGRDTCPVCLIYNSVLHDLVEDNSYKIYKFDTDIWRKHNSFESILSLYSIHDIPAIVKIDNTGNVASAFIESEADIDIIRDRLASFLSEIFA